MCEIAIIDPEEMEIQQTQQLAGIFHEEQGDGLGVVAIHHDDEAFSYDTYKSVHPHWQTLYSFLRRNYNAWRIVVHGRAKTTGEVNRDTAHPIAIDCSACDFDYVVHNGHVRGHAQKRATLANKGHWFQTDVDTEIIAHEVSELPDTVEGHTRGTYNLQGNLNYILLSTDGILIRSGTKYDLSPTATMTCRFADFEEPEEVGFKRGRKARWALISPTDDAEPEIEIENNVIKTTTAYRGGTSKDRRFSGTPGKRGEWASDDSENTRTATTSGEVFTVEYRDLSSYNFLSVAEVAPGVLKLFDNERGEESVIRREMNPRLYYHYVDEREPENLDQLEKIAERLRDGADGVEEVEEIVKERTAQTVEDVADLEAGGEEVEELMTWL